MSVFGLLGLALNILNGVLGSIKGTGVATEVVAGIQAAVDALAAVHGTDVTKAQLEGLRVSQIS